MNPKIDCLAMAHVRLELSALLGTNVVRVDPDHLGPTFDDKHLWNPMPLHWGAVTDLEIGSEVGLVGSEVTGSVVVVTDVSFSAETGAFVFPARDFATFAEAYRERFGERVFAGTDVIAWNRDTSELWVFHHEGVFARLRLS